MKLLAAGDIHLGRASTRLPDAMPIDRARARDAWEALVELAIGDGVDLLLLTGDVTDQDNRFWEAVGPLERGLDQLHQAGVDVYAVAGNHDHQTLPRLAKTVGTEKLRLLGEGGQWQRRTIERDGRARLTLDGWSFPAEHVDRSPLIDYAPSADAPAPVLGMVHGDLDVTGSRYAPLASAELHAAKVDGWLLGHIHQPSLDAAPGRPFVLYPGSPQALDPGEPGAHGAWRIDVTEGRVGEPRFVPLSTVRYEALEISLEGVDERDEFDRAVYQRIREAAEPLVAASGERLACLSLRARLVGRTALCAALPKLVAPLREGLADLQVGSALLDLERVTLEASPRIEMEPLRRDDRSALGELARLIGQLESDSPDEPTAALIRRTQRRITEARGERAFAGLPHEPADEATARDYLLEQARLLLGALHEQLEEVAGE